MPTPVISISIIEMNSAVTLKRKENARVFSERSATVRNNSANIVVLMTAPSAYTIHMIIPAQRLFVEASDPYLPLT